MNDSSTQALTELASMADTNHWSALARLVDGVRQPDTRSVVLATSKTAPLQHIQAWIAQQEPSIQATCLPLDQLAQEPQSVLNAQKIVAVFVCGELIDANEADAVHLALLPRPASSYAIVLAGAERIATLDDLEMVGGGVRRLLAPDGARNADSTMSPLRCYLWSEQSVADVIQQAVQQDKNDLADWLRTPLAEADAIALRVYQTNALLLNAESLAKAARASATPTQMQRLLDVRDALANVRQRLQRRLNSEEGVIVREITASLQQLENALDARIPSYLRQRFRGHLRSLTEDNLKRALTDLIVDGARSWGDTATRMLADYARSIVSTTRADLQLLDWELINQLSRASGSQATYPDSIFKSLTTLAEANAPSLMTQQNALGMTAPMVRRGDPTIALPVLAGAAGATVAWLAGLKWAGAIAGGGIGIAGGALIQRRLSADKALDDAENYAMSAIGSAIRTATTHAQAQVRDSIGALVKTLNDTLRELENLTQHNITELRAASSQQSEADSNLLRLEALREALYPSDEHAD